MFLKKIPLRRPGLSSQGVPAPNLNFSGLLKFRKPHLFLFFSLLFFFFSTGCREAVRTLNRGEKQTLQRILEHWETWMPQKKKQGTAPLLDFEELQQGLGPEEQAFLRKIWGIRLPNRPHLGFPEKGTLFIRIEDEGVIRNGKKERLDPQYLPEPVYQAYQKMMTAMEKDLEKRLRVDSGFRSPAYQLYTFLFYLPKHDHSIGKTREWVALPGYSEHGSPSKQAIDFINEQGINGEDRAEDFENLSEYGWLLAYAGQYGFELSYPRGIKGTTFEPWHWRFCNGSCKNAG